MAVWLRSKVHKFGSGCSLGCMPALSVMYSALCVLCLCLFPIAFAFLISPRLFFWPKIQPGPSHSLKLGLAIGRTKIQLRVMVSMVRIGVVVVNSGLQIAARQILALDRVGPHFRWDLDYH